MNQLLKIKLLRHQRTYKRNYNHQTIVLFHFNLRDEKRQSMEVLLLGCIKPLEIHPPEWIAKQVVSASTHHGRRDGVLRLGATGSMRGTRNASTASSENTIFHGA